MQRGALTIAAAISGIAASVACGAFSAADAPDPGPADAAPEATTTVQGDATACDASFCDDFDDGVIGEKWSSVVLEGGVLFADESTFTSPPRALGSATDAGLGATSPGRLNAYLTKEIGAAKRVRCAFDVRLGAVAPGSGHVDLFVVRSVMPDGSDHELILAANDKVMTIRDDLDYADGGCPGCPVNERKLGDAAPGVWERWTVETDFQNVRVERGNVILVNEPFATVAPERSLVLVGLRNLYGAALTVDYDTVRCDITN